ncbi:hypothetical protein M514_07807 [Trichuris suis]|uniref:Uncharacterized protein n=1 Tax=Trichuris suis TaxID=68888 RepID=A0A085MUH5_9BILA|nr:hypothetical protein M513_07807 [Trichuris suis]KFD60871.1 hypothetical protein M514_07807 [Trichuris suis]
MNDNTQICIVKLRTGACDLRRSDFFWLRNALDVFTAHQNSSTFYLFLSPGASKQQSSVVDFLWSRPLLHQEMMAVLSKLRQFQALHRPLGLPPPPLLPSPPETEIARWGGGDIVPLGNTECRRLSTVHHLVS